MKLLFVVGLIAVLGVGVSEACQCTDIRPLSAPEFSCAEQASFGKCDRDYLEGYCNLSCERCGDKCDCVDRQPMNTTFTCEEFATFGGCSKPWMRDGFYCAVSCGFCDPATGEVFDEGIEEIVPDVALNFGIVDTTSVVAESAVIESDASGDVMPNTPTKPEPTKSNKKKAKKSKKAAKDDDEEIEVEEPEVEVPKKSKKNKKDAEVMPNSPTRPTAA